MKLVHFSTLSSTNTYLKQHAAEYPTGTVVIADVQTEGRGRLGRSWQMPGGNLCFSVLFADQSGDWSLYPLCCAVAAAEVLEETMGESIGIKWPNDLILKGKKLCGILCEAVPSANDTRIICGIGVNVSLEQADFDRMELPYATSVKLATGRVFNDEERLSLAKKIAARLIETVDNWKTNGFSALKPRYDARLLNQNREVRVLYQNRTIEAVARGINEQGYLVCEANGSRFTVHSGEASVRGLYGYV